MQCARWETFRGDDGRIYWHLRAAGATTENEIIATGEGYSSEGAALSGIEAVKRGVLSSCGIDTTSRIVHTEVTGDGDPAAPPKRRYFVEVDAELVGQLPA